jgi:hypothetical protein
MCLRRAPEEYIAGAALDRAGIDSRLTDESKVVSPTHLPHFTPQKHYYFSVSGIHFDRLCGLVVKVPGYRSRDLDSRRYQIF